MIIEEKSLAWQMQLPSRMEPYIYGAKDVPAVITEVDGFPLNPFDRSEQFFARLEKLEPNSTFNLIIHPSDLVKLIRKQLKQSRNFKRFIHDS